MYQDGAMATFLESHGDTEAGLTQGVREGLRAGMRSGLYFNNNVRPSDQCNLKP